MKKISKAKFGFTCLWVVLALCVLIMPRQFMPVCVFISVLFIGYVFARNTAGDEASRLYTIFLVSYILRVVWMMIMYKLSFQRGLGGYFLGGDDWTYADTGLRIANCWRAGYFPEFLQIERTMSLSGTLDMYEFYLAGLFLITGNSSFMPLMMNCSFAATSVLIMYYIADKLFSRKIALITCLLIGFWPSLMFWSTQNLKEASTIFCVVLITAFLIRAAVPGDTLRVRAKYLTFSLIVLFVLYAYRIRIAFFVILALLMCAGLVLARRACKKRLSFLLFMAVIFFVLFTVVMLASFPSLAGPVGEKFNTITHGALSPFRQDVVKAIWTYRDVRALGESVIYPDLKLETTADLVRFLPLSLVIAFFFPLPFVSGSLIALMASQEMVMWYFMFPFFVFGVVRSRVATCQGKYFILFFLILYYLGLGLIEGNAGTLFRHRAIVFPFSLMYVALGIAGFKEKMDRIKQ